MPLRIQSTLFFSYSIVLSLFFLPFSTWTSLSTTEWIAVILLPLATVCQQIFWIQALLVVPIPIAASLTYLFLPLATLSGSILFNETISFPFIIGAILIVGGGFLILFELSHPSPETKNTSEDS